MNEKSKPFQMDGHLDGRTDGPTLLIEQLRFKKLPLDLDKSDKKLEPES